MEKGGSAARAAGVQVHHCRGDRIELDLLRKHQRQYAFTAIPVGALFLALALQPVFSGDKVDELRKVGWSIGLIASSKALLHLLVDSPDLLQHLVDATDLQAMKCLCMRLEHVTVGHRILMQAICLAYDGVWGSTLLRGLSLIIMPLSTARQCSCYLHFSLYVVATMLSTLFCFRQDLGGEGWQWICLVCLTTTISADIITRRFEADGAFQSLNTTCTAMHGLLSMICDGFLLLDDNGAIVAVDQKAAHMLGKDLNSNWVGLDFKQFLDLDACATNPDIKRGQWQGLEKVILRAGHGEKLDVETYNVPCVVQPNCIPLILGHEVVPEDIQASTHFCAIRVMQQALDDKQTPSEETPPPAMAEQLLGTHTPTIEDFGEECLHFPSHGGTDELCGRCAAGLMMHGLDTGDSLDAASEVSGTYTQRSTRTTLSTAGPAGQPGQTFLDSPLKMVPALGLGGGTYAVVRNVAHSFTTTVMQVRGEGDQTYALKRVKLPGMLWQRDFPKNLRNLDREVRSLKTLKWASSVIVCLVDCWLEADFQFACIVMEWLPMTLAKLQEGRSRGSLGPLCLATTCRYSAQLSMGLTVIHSACLMHRDLKPSNILLTGDLQYCKIADLGVSRSLLPKARGPPAKQLQPWGQDGSDSTWGAEASGASVAMSMDGASEAGESNVLSLASRYSHNVGTRAYASPESVQGGSYDERVDIFSLGCVIFELLTLRRAAELRADLDPSEAELPARAQGVFEECGDEAHESEPPSPSGATPGRRRRELQDLVLEMLDPRCCARPAAAAVVASRVLQPDVLELLQLHPELQRTLPKGAASPQHLSEHSDLENSTSSPS